ncbi:MAG: hypothetical protein RLZZ450_7514 [Pseudomonadota bacterium]|jgi:hypothetical protein
MTTFRKAATSAFLALSFSGLISSVGCSESEPRAIADAAVQGTPSVGADAGDHTGHAGHGGALADCSSTFEAIEKTVFEGKGCTALACHGGANTGNLDLRHGSAYASLINRPASASLATPINLVTPGEQALSFLYLKLAAATDPTKPLPAGAGAPMPSGLTPLSVGQLEAVRLWIRGGAPQDGVVAGTQALLSCTQPTVATPNKSARPPIPRPAEGFQHASGPWVVKPNTENEVCFGTYYDLTASAPDWARVKCTIGGIEQDCVTYNRRELSQDAQSHHSIITVYGGAVPPSDPAWGAWTCAGGKAAGQRCDPTKSGVSAALGGAECGELSVCQAPPKVGTCTPFGPTDKEKTNSTVSAGGSQAPVSADRFPTGVYAQIPIKGIVLWNSHGFNLTASDADIEQYNSFWYARPEQRQHLMRGIFTPGKGGIAGSLIRVPPYQTQELCGLYTLPRYARLTELSAHAHKRSIEWRTWLPPQPAACPDGGCKPLDRAPDYRSTSYNDRVVLPYEPPRVFDQEDEASRTLLFCSKFDNGNVDPTLLKRKSVLIEGSDCVSSYTKNETLYCVDGDKKGQACTSTPECGAGGVCDACQVEWGERTEDEMFFLMGQFYVQPPAP